MHKMSGLSESCADLRPPSEGVHPYIRGPEKLGRRRTQETGAGGPLRRSTGGEGSPLRDEASTRSHH